MKPRPLESLRKRLPSPKRTLCEDSGLVKVCHNWTQKNYRPLPHGGANPLTSFQPKKIDEKRPNGQSNINNHN